MKLRSIILTTLLVALPIETLPSPTEKVNLFIFYAVIDCFKGKLSFFAP